MRNNAVERGQGRCEATARRLGPQSHATGSIQCVESAPDAPGGPGKRRRKDRAEEADDDEESREKHGTAMPAEPTKSEARRSLDCCVVG